MTAHTQIVDPETAYGLMMAGPAKGENERAAIRDCRALWPKRKPAEPAPIGTRAQERRKLDRREKLVAALRRRGHSRAASLAEEFGCRDELILKDLRDLLAEGRVKRDQPPMNGNPGATVLWSATEAKA